MTPGLLLRSTATCGIVVGAAQQLIGRQSGCQLFDMLMLASGSAVTL
jgi:hypothetical protein